jgi:hypothetical protein
VPGAGRRRPGTCRCSGADAGPPPGRGSGWPPGGGSSTQKLTWLTVNFPLRVGTTIGARSCAWMFTRPDTATRRSVPEAVSRGCRDFSAVGRATSFVVTGAIALHGSRMSTKAPLRTRSPDSDIRCGWVRSPASAPSIQTSVHRPSTIESRVDLVRGPAPGPGRRAGWPRPAPARRRRPVRCAASRRRCGPGCRPRPAGAARPPPGSRRRRRRSDTGGRTTEETRARPSGR